MKKLKLPFRGERSMREEFPAGIENACIKSIDIDVIGHFGDAITLDMPISLGGSRLANPLSGRDLTNHVGKFIQVLFRLLALSEEDGKKLSEIKEVPCRVVFCYDTIVGLGHFLDDRFMLFDELLEILVNEGSEEEKK